MKRILIVFLITVSIILFTGCPSPDSGGGGGSDSKTDESAPEVEIVNPEDGGLVSGSLLIAGTAIDVSEIDSVELRIDGDSWESLPSPGYYWTYLVDTFQLTEGDHTVRVQATDENGYVSTVVSATFTVDQQVPSITIESPAHGDRISGDDVTIQVEASDLNGIKSVLVNPNQGGQFYEATYNAPYWEYNFNTETIDDGEVFISALAYDNADMYAITNIAVIIDNTPPEVTITSPADGATVSADFDFEGTASDSQGIDRVMVKVCDTAQDLANGISEWTYPVAISLLDENDNPNTISVIAYDIAGNHTEELIGVYADETPPAITISTPAADSYIKGTSVSIEGTVADINGTDVQIDIADGAGFVPVDTFDGLNWTHDLDTTVYGVDGLQTITLRAVDSVTYAWDEETIDYYIDNTDPTGSIMSPADGNSIAQALDIYITGSASDEMLLASAQLTIGVEGTFDVSFTPGTHYWTYIWNTTGYSVSDEVDITLTVTDEAGNVYNTAATTVTISSDPPYGTITLPEQGDVVGGTIEIAGTAGDNGTVTSVDYQFDSTTGTWLSTDYAAGSWSSNPDYNTSGLSDGLHDLYVQITDNDTNTTIVQISVVVDNAPPEITMTYPTDANQGEDFLYDIITITGTASDANLASVVVDINTDSYFPVVTGLTDWSSLWDTATYPTAQTGVVVRATATDEAGNTKSVTATVAVKPKITSISAESVFTGEEISIEGYNFIDDVNTAVRFTSSEDPWTVDASSFTVVDDNNITVTVPSDAISGDMYVVEGTGAVESNHVYLHVWDKEDISGTGDAVDQDMFIDGSDTYQAMYDGGGTKDLRFSKNAGASDQLDTGGGPGNGHYPSIAVNGTNVFVAYINAEDDALRIIRSFDSGSNWQAPQEFSGFSINKDAVASLAYDPVSNVIGITYQTIGGTLGYVTSTDNDAQPGDTWIATPVEIDDTTGSGFYSHLAYNSNGTPFVAYYNTVSKELKFAYYTGLFWSIKDVDTSDLQGQFLSMALDSDDGIHISYYNGQSGDLMYGYSADKLGSFTVTNVDSEAITGYYTDIAIDPVTGNPHIAYIDYSYSQLKYAYYTGSAWEIIPVPDSIINVTIAKTAMVVDSSGTRYIGFGDGDGAHRLKYLD